MFSRPDDRYDCYFEKLRQRISTRLADPDHTAWLFRRDDSQANGCPFAPDYLQFSSVGRKESERRVNRTLFQVSETLWFRLFWPRIRRGLLDFMRTSYFPLFLSQSDQSRDMKNKQQQAYAAIEQMLGQHWQGLGDCTFSEMGIMVNEILKECYRDAGYPEDLFAGEKQYQNAVALKAAIQHGPRVLVQEQEREREDQALDLLVYTACAANWIDSLDKDVRRHLHATAELYDPRISPPAHIAGAIDSNPYFQLDRLKAMLRTGKHILYECDNCGEVVFDLMLIQYLLSRGHRFTIAAKAGPALNDATISDIEELLRLPLFSELKNAVAQGLVKLLPIDSVMGGKLLYEVGAAYKTAYAAADLLILKGQGNFQTMPAGRLSRGGFIPRHYRKPLAFMFPVKSVMARLCLQTVFTREPQHGTLMLLCYDANDPQNFSCFPGFPSVPHE